MKLIGLAVIMALAGGSSASDAAVKYYSRQKLGVIAKAPVSYSGTWASSKTYGSCTAKSRTVTTVGTCSGGTCDPSADPSGTTTQACTSTCGALTLNSFVSATGGLPAYTTYPFTTQAAMLANAKSVCEGSATTACMVAYIGGGVGTNYNVYPFTKAASLTSNNQGYYWSASCS